MKVYDKIELADLIKEENGISIYSICNGGDFLTKNDAIKINNWYNELQNKHHNGDLIKNINLSFIKENRIEGQETCYGFIHNELEVIIREAEPGVNVSFMKGQIRLLSKEDLARKIYEFIDIISLAISDPEMFHKFLTVENLNKNLIINKEQKTTAKI